MTETAPKIIEGSARLGPASGVLDASASAVEVVDYANPFGTEFDVPEHDADEIEYDRWGRYANLPAIPGVCGVQPWTRVSTIAKVMDDPFFLDRWKRRQVLIGIKRNPSLLDRLTPKILEHVANHRVTPMPKRTKDLLNATADEAMKIAGSLDGATAGTAFHTLMEIIDAGDLVDLDTLSEEDSLMIGAYARTIEQNDIKMIPELIERVIAIPELGLAGRLDRVLLDGGVPRIGDVKSQATMDFGHISLAAQLAAYANASWMLDMSVKPWKWVPMADVDKRKGVVIWTPATQPGVAEIYDIDLVKGWDFVKTSVEIRQARKLSGLVKRRPS